MKRIWSMGAIYFVFIIFMIINTIVALLFDKRAFLVSLIFTITSAALAVYRLISMQNKLGEIVNYVSNDLSSSESKALWELKVPVMIATGSGEIVWYNSTFENSISNAEKIVGSKLESLIGSDSCEQLKIARQSEIMLCDKIFAIYRSPINRASDTLDVYYLFDQTNYKKTAFEYTQSRPVVTVITFDNLDEITKNARDSEIAAFKSTIQTEIEKWSSQTTGIIRKMTGDKYLMVLDERSLTDLIESRFSILKTVREHRFGEASATLSIGAGRGGATYAECEELANQALDMALGRGGDQAVIKNQNNEFKFFGGLSNAVEKRTKVRARIVASALRELMESSNRIIIMGHRFADLDCFGASFGLYSAARSMGKEAYIVMDKDKSMAKPLMKRIESIGADCAISDGADLLGEINRDTLLIITDVHRPMFLENSDIYRACQNVVVIDHHRKAVDYIDNAVIFYHEAGASSTCEMVTELLQYINPKCVGQIEAEALLAGIMLDTRNFVMHTGVRTFEASAFLRNRGADPISVKKLFSGSMPSYRQRANIVASAELYDDCAIAENQVQDENTKLATSQAADELLGINGVQSSFVLCRLGDEINISARSLGSVNVQLIMESLGGGGHRTMAACQLATKDFEEAKLKLINAINEYKANQSVTENIHRKD
ncbi:MAG: DHH family phosphoesterase [Oscillospiraceae bacterium]|nr:DHH family phosphoesterase [Oscillospiraceae bacterium]